MDQEPSPRDAAAATDMSGWLMLMDQIGEEDGYFQPLGESHWSFFADDGPILLVTFETVESCRARAGQMPWGHHLARAMGWSHLCVIADGPTWYRDPAVYAFFDRLVDEAFFEDFDRVILYGAGMGAYAACAFSITAPGATVVAVQTRATLDPVRTGWDMRDKAQRRLDFTTRYGFAPRMVEGTGRVFLVFDPDWAPDAGHAALFTSLNTSFLPCRHGGPDLARMLERMGLTARLLEKAGDDQLSRQTFLRLWRGRRSHEPYLRRLLQLNSGKPMRETMIRRSVTRRLGLQLRGSDDTL